MMATQTLAPADFARLRQLDTCLASNAIEILGVRPRNEGFAYGTAHCMFPDLPSTLGYAVTGRIRTSTQPVTGGAYYDNIEWWRYFNEIPPPRMMVLEDVDEIIGFGAFVGEIHANIAAALECVGCVTNGVVRDLGPIEALGFQLFAGGVSPSHAYAHIVSWGETVEIGGLKVNPGDLVHGDRHGVLVVPFAVAADVARVAERLDRDERKLLDLCQSPTFSLDALSNMFDSFRTKHLVTFRPPEPRSSDK